MARSAAAQVAGLEPPGGTGGTPEKPARPWWRIPWSVPAAMRAVRATIVIPGLLALTFKVIGDAQMALFAVFGSFAQLVTVTFGGTRRDKAVAHLLLTAAGSVAVVIGTFASGSAWLAALVTLVTAFAIYCAGSAGPNAAAGVTSCLFALVLPVASVGTASVLASRVEGWLLASAASTLAVLLLSPRPAGDPLRAQAAKLASMLADQLAATMRGTRTEANDDVTSAARHELMNAYVASPYRPIGLAAADHALASTIHLLDWCSALIGAAANAHQKLPAAQPDRDLMTLCIRTLREVAAVLSGQRVTPDLEAIYRGRLAAAEHLHEIAHDAASAEQRAVHAFHALATAVATAATIGAAMIAARRSTPAQVARLRRRWIAGLPDTGTASASRTRPAGVIAEDPALRWVWVRSSARAAIALAAAVAVARVIDVQHAFWVVLGTLSVLKTTATATSSTALRGLAGTIAGFAVGAALLVAIGTNPTALWIAYPLAMLVAAYTPGVAPFVFGQAAFTVTSVVLFNLLAPVGWRVGLLRVEDIAIGCAVSLVVGFLLWPRGISSIVSDDLANAFASGAGYLGDAASGALGDRQHQPERAAAAIEADDRLENALLGFLTEQGSKQLSKADLWALATAAMRLRLTADTMASLPTPADPNDDDRGLRAAVRRQVAALASFYSGVAAEIARPSRTRPALATVSPPPPSLTADEPASRRHASTYRSDVLLVGYLVDHLAAGAAHLTGPAERLASLRRRHWWR